MLILNIIPIKSSKSKNLFFFATDTYTYSDRNRASIPSGRKSLIVETIHPWVTEKKQIVYHHDPLLFNYKFST